MPHQAARMSPFAERSLCQREQVYFSLLTAPDNFGYILRKDRNSFKILNFDVEVEGRDGRVIFITLIYQIIHSADIGDI